MPYYRFKNEDGEEYGSFETFHVSPSSAKVASGFHEDEQPSALTEPGWYWWACFPGCLPDGEPSGPFETEADAIADANDGA